MQLSKSGTKIEHSFSIPLPENLPSSLYYCGEFMSRLGVVYELNANIVGLKPSAAGLPEGTTLFAVK